MLIQKINPRITVLLIFIVAVAALRVPNAAQLTGVANFTPLGAMALFSGAYFTKQWKAILFPLLTLFISDLVIQSLIFKGKYGILYGGWYWTYTIFILITIIGKKLITNVTVTRVCITAVTVSLFHWLVSDFLVWAGGGTDLRSMQPLSKDWQGLLQCYTQGFTFMKNFLTGTLLYSAIMFGGFELIKRKFPSLQLNIA